MKHGYILWNVFVIAHWQETSKIHRQSVFIKNQLIKILIAFTDACANDDSKRKTAIVIGHDTKNQKKLEKNSFPCYWFMMVKNKTTDKLIKQIKEKHEKHTSLHYRSFRRDIGSGNLYMSGTTSSERARAHCRPVDRIG